MWRRPLVDRSCSSSGCSTGSATGRRRLPSGEPHRAGAPPAQLIAEGLTNRQIGERMFLAENGQERVSTLLGKLGLERRTRRRCWPLASVGQAPLRDQRTRAPTREPGATGDGSRPEEAAGAVALASAFSARCEDLRRRADAVVLDREDEPWALGHRHLDLRATPGRGGPGWTALAQHLEQFAGCRRQLCRRADQMELWHKRRVEWYCARGP